MSMKINQPRIESITSMNRDELKQSCVENGISHRNMDGKTLRALRDKLGFTQTEMGEKLGITASAVAHLESGKNKVTQQTAMLAEMLSNKP